MDCDSLAHELQQWMEQGKEYIKQKNNVLALSYFNKVVLQMPMHIEALTNCAKILIDLNRSQEALIYTQRALQEHSTCAILSLQGKAFYQIGEYQAALDCFKQIALQEPTNFVALGHQALCLTQINGHDQAVQIYQQALALGAHQDDWIYYNYSLCLLAIGNLLLGFSFFEYRWRCPLSTKNRLWIMPEIADREVLQGKSILVYAEQGLGDNIQFFRYIPLLVSLGAQVFLEIQPTLISLFHSWHPTINFIALGSVVPDCDYYCPLMSLARIFKTDIHNIPQCIPYISPDRNAFEACQKKLGASTRTRAGIAWRGSDLNPMNSHRSLSLNILLSVYQPQIEWICLQKDVYLEEKTVLDRHQILYHGLELSTMVGTAALIACLDLVITIDTSIAHLAAAMGKKVWILLPMNADWRWLLHREDSPWYHNVTLFRQTILKDWSVPVSKIKKALSTFQPIAAEGSVEDLMHQAAEQFQKGFWYQAQQIYRNILVRNPVCPQALNGMALAAFHQNHIANALQFMHQTIAIAPQNALYRRNLGELLRRVTQLDAAITSHKTAIQIEPHIAEQHFLLALAYNNHQQLELSIQHYRIALSYDDNYGLAWNNLGTSLEGLGDKDRAKEAYTKAIQLNPNHVEAQNNLGAILSEEGCLDEAMIHFEAAIAANPDFIDAHYNLSLLKTYTPSDPHLTFLEANLKTMQHCTRAMQIRYYFALGKAYDDTQQYQRAFQAYAEGNRLHYQYQTWNDTFLNELVSELPKIFPKNLFAQAPKITESRCPIFIVGMPRSGTTLIEQILASHEHIHGAGELSILDDVIQEAHQATQLPFKTWIMQLDQEAFAQLGKKYLNKVWKLAPDKNYIIDKMPSNFFYIGMIQKMLPTAKIIHTIRDPMDSCFSCFSHLFKSGMAFAYDLTALGNYYILYAKTMQYWQTILPKTALFDLPYEQMVAHPEILAKQVLDYIGLPWDPNCLLFYKNKRIVKTASLSQVRQPIYATSIQRWQHFANDLQSLLQIVAPYRNVKGISQ